MVEIIASDFEVTVVAQQEENYFLADKKNVFFHFVFFQNQEDYNEVKQYYLHRYELADWLNKVINKKEENDLNVASGLVNLSFHSNGEERILIIQYDEVAFEMNLIENDFGKQLLADLTLLEKVDAESTKKAFNKKIISAVLDEFDEHKNYPFSDSHLRIAAFELKILKKITSRHHVTDYFKLLQKLNLDSKDVDSYMVYNLKNSLEAVVGKTACDCGSEGCFFDLLHKAYITFFTEEDLLVEENLDEEKVTIELNKIWNNLDSKSRSVMNFLEIKFGNTPLINLYLLTKNASFEEYIYKMTFPYQPDSEDDAFVRRLVSLVRFYNCLC